jgi:hypothetical protein
MEDIKQQVIRDTLSGDYLEISKRVMFENIDSFVALSPDNPSVKSVVLYPFDSAPGSYWDKVGQIVGNLMELKTITISFLPSTDDEDDDDVGDEARIPTWETLGRILPYVQHKVSLYAYTDHDAEVEEIRGLARAIRGNPMISKFSSEMEFTFENIGPWCSALTALPSLERVTFGLREPEREDQRVLLNLEPFKELLRTPALRVVRFARFHFTNELCHATANALEEGLSITAITFNNQCTFPDGGRALILKALKTNASVTDVQFLGDCDESVCNTLAAVLLCNSTLRNLTLWLPEASAVGRWLSSVFFCPWERTRHSRVFLSAHSTSWGTSYVQPLRVDSQRTQR